jgi:hypothetical protein
VLLLPLPYPGPVWFHRSLRVTIQQIGHCFGERLDWLKNHGETVYGAGPGLVPVDFSAPHEQGILFERQDDWSSCAYFYFDRPVSDLPPLADAGNAVPESEGEFVMVLPKPADYYVEKMRVLHVEMRDKMLHPPPRPGRELEARTLPVSPMSVGGHDLHDRCPCR